MEIKNAGIIVIALAALISACKPDSVSNENSGNHFYPTSKPCTRWWWFATEIKKPDIKHQLDWMKANNFGGVEIAWVYPLYRYQRMYKRNYNRHYPKDTTAQEWLSPEWTEVVKYTKLYADSIGLACDFTFGSAWPVAASDLDPKYGTKVYGDTSFRQTLTFSWAWPDTQLVINHLDEQAFDKFSEQVEPGISPALTGRKNALFTDSWEIKMNDKYKVWTEGFELTFEEEFGYDILPYMDQGIDSFPDVRYDYMLHIDDYVTNGFYKPYVEKCKELNAWSRVQCLASPTDVMTTYSLVDIPETEAMLNNPNYSRVVSSSACLAGKSLVSCESFTCMYGFPSTYLRQEQAADLKMVADALFAQGVNQHFYHGTPYNPIGSDTLEFFATTYFGPGGSLEKELPEFNSYIEKVSGLMQQGKTYTDVAVYIPYEDAVMKGALPKEKQRVWVWGEYELRYVDPPEELAAYHPLWINRHFLEKAEMKNGKLCVGDAEFSALCCNVEYMDERAMKRMHTLAEQGLEIILLSQPKEPGKTKNKNYNNWLASMQKMPNVSSSISAAMKHPPLIKSEKLLWHWAKKQTDGSLIIFIAQPLSKELKYPVYSGQSYMESSEFIDMDFHYNGHDIPMNIEFKPYQSVMIKISKDGKAEYLDISYTPKDPEVKPREKQKMYF